jgi:hypothetical protein
MSSLWPWLAVAGMGALHGLNPATGWMFAVACGVQARDRTQALRVLWPIALGHLLSVALVAGCVALGLSMDGVALQIVAAALLVIVLGHYLLCRKGRHGSVPSGAAGLALWSFIMATAHGAGFMLVPALIPLCMSGTPAREITASGSLALALIAVGVHMAAMLAVTGTMASGVCHAIAAGKRLLRDAQPTHPPAR